MKKILTIILSLLCLLCESLHAQNFNYAEVLQKSIFFYECQRSGILPPDNRVSWRGNSAVIDGQDVGLDLTGGWYDAGDHVKFGFPMAFSATILALGGIEYEEGYKQAGQWEYLLDNLRWVNDYFIKCHPSPNEFYGQVGNGQLDHAWWGSAEVMQMERPSYKIDETNPGTELAAETAAAMAAASIIFASEDPAYSQQLIEHAEQLYDFADNFRGSYSEAIPDAAAFYRSWSGYQDELVWGAIVLYMATNDPAYLQKAELEYADLSTEPQLPIKSYKWTIAWDDKGYGCYVLLAKLTEKAQYKEDAERWLDYWTDGFEGNQITYTPGGLAWLDQWGSLRYSANTSLMAFIYSDVTDDAAKKEKYYNFAVSQINYMLGENPNQRSYVVGFGENPPLNPHHRTAHGTWTNNLKTPEGLNNRHILYGALVGGPDQADSYLDDRGDYIANEVACDYNACFSGSVARMVQDFGGEALGNFPIPEVPTDEFGVLGRINAQTGSFTQVAINAYNRSAWPARALESFSIRYFVDLTEVFDAGYALADLYTKLSFGKNITISDFQLWEDNVYYIEINFNQLFAPIGDGESKAEVQFEVGIRGNVQSGWSSANDWSFQGLDEAANYLGVDTDNIPVYENGVLIAGSEPAGGQAANGAPTASFQANEVAGLAPLIVSFDATASSDPEGDALTYVWDFGDGNTGTGASVSHTFTELGSYLVTLTVTDATGKTDKSSTTIEVLQGEEAPNGFPTAIFTASTQTGEAPLLVEFDATQSTDPEQEALTYSWDFEVGSTAEGVSASYTFTQAGAYEVVLTVTDEKGQSDTYNLVIQVSGEGGNGDTGGGTDTTSCSPNFLSVTGNQLLNSKGESVRLTGVNWFGFETNNFAFHGLWSRDMYSVLQQIKDLGFNAIRVPWCNEMLEPGATMNSVSINPSVNDSYSGQPLNVYVEGVTSPIELMDLMVEWCEQNDIKIIMDNHSREAGGYLNEAYWYTEKYPEEKWIEDWIFIADRYKNYSSVAVADINNEPHADDITWGYGDDPTKDWAKAAERCAEAIWEVNPNIVICVEGIHFSQEGKHYWWGGNLADVRNYQLQVSQPDKIIYSFHEYGPEVYKQPWFEVSDFPANLDTLWNDRWAFIHDEEIGHLYMGEFGIKDKDAFGGVSFTWITELMNFMGNDYSWTFWCMNPNSGDTGGILQDDWNTVHQWKMDILSPYLDDEIPNCISGGNANPNPNPNPTETNITPIARIVTSLIEGSAPLTVNFDGTTSSDPDGDALTYTWDLAGENTVISETTSHTFGEPGTYIVSLVVEDGKGGVDEAKVNIVVQPDVTTSINPNTINAFKFEAFPNPATNELNVRIEGKLNTAYQLELFNLQGQRLLQTTIHRGQNAGVFSVEHLAKGMYMLSVKSIDDRKSNPKYTKVLKQ